jgi:hypothetical protein
VVIDAPVATPFGLYSLVVLDRASGKVLGKQPLLCDTVLLDRPVSIEKPTSDVAVELPWEAIETYVWRDAEDVDEEEHVSKRLKTLKNPREIFDALRQGVCNPCNPCNLFILAIFSFLHSLAFSCIVALVVGAKIPPDEWKLSDHRGYESVDVSLHDLHKVVPGNGLFPRVLVTFRPREAWEASLSRFLGVKCGHGMWSMVLKPDVGANFQPAWKGGFYSFLLAVALSVYPGLNC